MERQHRISAGAIVIHEGKMLLVRYVNRSGKTFLVGPGGGVNNEESTNRALIREVREETGLEVSPQKVLFVEDLLSKRHRIIKIWFLCFLIGGKLEKTRGAIEEEIIEAGWYSRDQLKREVVYPTPVMDYNWDTFSQDSWETVYLELRETDF
jgi:8-oxo-dGTP pyrophosphatase MutT (NUDIX family)